MEAERTGARISWREDAGTSPADDGASLRTPVTIVRHGGGPASVGKCRARSAQSLSIVEDVLTDPGKRDALSARAENVLKGLAFELTGECPPKGRWLPSDRLLRKLSYNDLRVARNCGPRTTEEIVRWARLRGIVIERPFHDGKPLSAMWRDTVEKFSTAGFAKAEIVQALERSMRRKNTRIPVAFQDILVKLLNSNAR